MPLCRHTQVSRTARKYQSLSPAWSQQVRASVEGSQWTTVVAGSTSAAFVTGVAQTLQVSSVIASPSYTAESAFAESALESSSSAVGVMTLDWAQGLQKLKVCRLLSALCTATAADAIELPCRV